MKSIFCHSEKCTWTEGIRYLPIMNAGWCLQIGLINAGGGLQIGLLNYNEEALIPLFHHSTILLTLFGMLCYTIVKVN